ETAYDVVDGSWHCGPPKKGWTACVVSDLTLFCLVSIVSSCLCHLGGAMLGHYPLRVRLRLPEVLDEHDPPLTAYEAAKRSQGRIIPSTLYRLVRQEGRVRLFDGELLEALCDVLGIEPGKLLERDKAKRGRK